MIKMTGDVLEEIKSLILWTGKSKLVNNVYCPRYLIFSIKISPLHSLNIQKWKFIITF